MKKLFLFITSLFICNTIFGQEQNFTIQHDGKNRDFIFYSPCQNYDCTGKTLPLIFAFHGLTETNTAVKNYSKFNEMADTAGFAVIYAQGLNNSWNVGFNADIASGEDDIGFANAMIDFAINNPDCQNGVCVKIDTNRIYSCGMSNGGFFSYLLACQLSHRIAAIASVTGTMNISIEDICQPVRPVPVFDIHGTSDPIVNYNGGGNNKSMDEVIAFWVNQNGCTGNPNIVQLPDLDPTDGSTIESFQYDNCDEGSEVLHYKINGGGHTWTGMENPYPAFIVGTNNNDVFASQEIWMFFKRHSLNTTTSVKEVFLNDFQVQVYPNPVENKLTLEVESISDLKIMDFSGRIISHHYLNNGTNHIETYDLPQGIYFGTVQENRNVHHFKFVKQ